MVSSISKRVDDMIKESGHQRNAYRIRFEDRWPNWRILRCGVCGERGMHADAELWQTCDHCGQQFVNIAVHDSTSRETTLPVKGSMDPQLDALGSLRLRRQVT